MGASSWYQRWFGEEYLQLYRHRSTAEAVSTVSWLLERLPVKSGSRVLDLACGNCRHALELAKRGFETCGLDLSWPLLQTVPCPPEHLLFRRTRGDMRRLPFKPGVFSLVLSLFTSFGYFRTRQEDLEVLREVARVLLPGGYFVLDFLNEARVKEELIREEQRILSGREVSIRRWLDNDTNCVEKEISFCRDDGSSKHYRESVHLYTKPDLEHLLRGVGLPPVNAFGDYAGEPYQANSPRLILVGVKSA